MGTTTTSAFAAALAARRDASPGHCCRVGELVDKLDTDSRADIIDAMALPVRGAGGVGHVEIVDALNAVLRDLGIDETVSRSTVGDHRNNSHEIELA